MRIYFLAVMTVVAFAVGCSSAEQSAGQVLDNANSAVKSTSKNLWVDPDPTDDVPAVSSGAANAVANANSAAKQTANDISNNQDRIWGTADDKDDELVED